MARLTIESGTLESFVDLGGRNVALYDLTGGRWCFRFK